MAVARAPQYSCSTVAQRTTKRNRNTCTRTQFMHLNLMRKRNQTEFEYRSRAHQPIAQSKFNQSRRFYFNCRNQYIPYSNHTEAFRLVVSHEFTGVGQRDDHFWCNSHGRSMTKKNVMSSMRLWFATICVLNVQCSSDAVFRLNSRFLSSSSFLSVFIVPLKWISISSDVDASAASCLQHTRHDGTRTHNLCIGNYHNNKP